MKKWVTARELPKSSRGSHVKVYSLLEDPTICAELRSYLRTNKWSMDPAKLLEYVKTTSIPAAVEKYVRNLVDEEMPRDSRSISSWSFSLASNIALLGRVLHLRQLVNFCTRKVSVLQSTRNPCIMMDTSDQMLLNTDKMCSFQPWRSIENDWWNTRLGTLKPNW